MTATAKDTSDKLETKSADVRQLAAPRHKWPRVPTYIHRDKSASGCDESEYECTKDGCGLVKITVHPPLPEVPYRAWRNRQGVRSGPGPTPVCEGAGT